MSLAIGVNLLPVFLTSLSLTFGGQDGLSQEQLGRLGAISFIGLVLGILIAGPASDRWGAKGFAIGGNGIMVFSLIGMSLAPDYGTLGLAVFWLGFGAGILDMILSPGGSGPQSGSKIGRNELVALLLLRRRGGHDSREHRRAPDRVQLAACLFPAFAASPGAVDGVRSASLSGAGGRLGTRRANPAATVAPGTLVLGCVGGHLSRWRDRTGDGSVATGLCRNYPGVSAVGWREWLYCCSQWPWQWGECSSERSAKG